MFNVLFFRSRCWTFNINDADVSMHSAVNGRNTRFANNGFCVGFTFIFPREISLSGTTEMIEKNKF